MWSKRLTSHKPEFPNRADIIRYLLQQMVEKKMLESWVHLELVEEGGWFSNLLSGKAPWIEVALIDNGFEVNLGLHKKFNIELSQFPNSWQKTGKNLWKVTTTDFSTLCDWIDLAFSKACSNSPTQKLSGWIEGL